VPIEKSVSVACIIALFEVADDSRPFRGSRVRVRSDLGLRGTGPKVSSTTTPSIPLHFFHLF